MVKATLGGWKNQTRRLVKAKPGSDEKALNAAYGLEIGMHDGKLQCLVAGDHGWVATGIKCPYGPVGRKLWVRETWGLLDTEPKDGPEDATIFYRATDGDRHDLRYQKWRPSIFMPRWASRITLEVTGIRVERLNDITDADALAEGIRPLPLQSADDPSAWYEVEPGVCQARSPRASYAALWEKINGKWSWAANPYVWVILYRKLAQDTSK